MKYKSIVYVVSFYNILLLSATMFSSYNSTTTTQNTRTPSTSFTVSTSPSVGQTSYEIVRGMVVLTDRFHQRAPVLQFWGQSTRPVPTHLRNCNNFPTQSNTVDQYSNASTTLSIQQRMYPTQPTSAAASSAPSTIQQPYYPIHAYYPIISTIGAINWNMLVDKIKKGYSFDKLKWEYNDLIQSLTPEEEYTLYYMAQDNYSQPEQELFDLAKNITK